MNDIEKFIFLYCQPTELYLSSDNLFFKIKTEVVITDVLNFKQKDLSGRFKILCIVDEEFSSIKFTSISNVSGKVITSEEPCNGSRSSHDPIEFKDIKRSLKTLLERSLEFVKNNVKMLVAAWLHDIVEDTSISLDLIQSEFGETVANYVYWLTNPSKPEDGNRAKRKEIDREHLRKAPPQAKTIKLAGIISNCSTIKERSPEFATTYIKEKQLMLEVLEGGDPVLMEQAKQLLGD